MASVGMGACAFASLPDLLKDWHTVLGVAGGYPDPHPPPGPPPPSDPAPCSPPSSPPPLDDYEEDHDDGFGEEWDGFWPGFHWSPASWTENLAGNVRNFVFLPLFCYLGFFGKHLKVWLRSFCRCKSKYGFTRSLFYHSIAHHKNVGFARESCWALTPLAKSSFLTQNSTVLKRSRQIPILLT
jgi:hypothetical protein